MSNPSSADGRRSSRITLSLPIVIHGKDAQQKAFRESTHTLIVNKHGAKFLTSQRLVLGAEVLIENPSLGSVAKANVVWVSTKRNQNGFNEAGVQLVDAQNIWGIEFPPDDWATNGKDQEALAAEEEPVPSQAPAETAPPPQPAPAESAPPARPAPKEIPPPARPAPAETAPPRTPPPALTSEEVATRFLRELHETADAHARRFRERLDQVMQRVGMQLEEDLRDRAEAAAAQQLAAVEDQILSSSERLGALRVELEELDARLSEYQVSLGVVLEKVPLPLTPEQIYEKMEPQALSALNLITESGIAAARERIQAQVQADFGQALAAWSNNLHAERDSLLEEARQQIMAVVASALEALSKDREAGLKETRRHIQAEIQENKERVVLQIISKLDETAESHRESVVVKLNDTFRETGERQAKLLQTQIDALLASRLGQAQQHALSLGESLQNKLEDGLRAAGEKSSQALQARLQEIADKTVASTADTVRKQVEESANAVAEKSFQAWQARLQEIANHAAASSSDQVQAQVNEALNFLGPKLQEMKERAVNDAVEAFRGRLSQFLGLLQPGGNK